MMLFARLFFYADYILLSAPNYQKISIKFYMGVFSTLNILMRESALRKGNYEEFGEFEGESS